MEWIKTIVMRALSVIVLSISYSASMLISKATDRRRNSRWKRSGRILVIGTFHNPNWFLSHIGPLTRCGVGDVIVVCDQPVSHMRGVRYACPPVFLSKLFSRAVCKFIWSIVCGFRYKPDLYMGYHIFPAAISALVVARIFGRPVCYQDTSGPLELEGGGWHAENSILVALGKACTLIERLVFKVVREFDLIVVRGSRAADFIRDIGYKRELVIITGSVEKQKAWREASDREFDIVFVGRLTEYKRPDRFISVASLVVKRIPEVRAVVIGDGPDKEHLKDQAKIFGMGNSIEFLGKRKDVPSLLAKSKVYVLTSRWEGLSIAMIEAMAAGAVPVVSDVGDLRDLVRNGVNGFVLPGEAMDSFCDKIVLLLSDEDMWREYSLSAVSSALDHSSIDSTSKRWETALRKVLR